jgi:hypothetical protein
MKKKKVISKLMTECERLQVIYEALENESKWDIKGLVKLFKDYKVTVTSSMVQKDLETLSKEIRINKTRSVPIKYSRTSDEYKELTDNIEAIKKTNDFKTLNHLIVLEKIHKKEIKNYTEILIGQLLRFDLHPDDIIHPWAYYMLMEESADRLKWILDFSPSTETLINDDRYYQYARKLASIDIGVDEKIFPKKNPYNLVEIIKKKRHPLFRFRDQYMNWRNNYEK